MTRGERDAALAHCVFHVAPELVVYEQKSLFQVILYLMPVRKIDITLLRHVYALGRVARRGPQLYDCSAIAFSPAIHRTICILVLLPGLPWQSSVAASWAKLGESYEQVRRIDAPPVYEEIRTGHGRRSDDSRSAQRR